VTVAYDSSSFNDPGPGVWYKDSSRYLLAEHTSDGSPVTHANPAKPGETITAYGNDFYSVWPPPPIGVPVPPTPRYEASPETGPALMEENRVYDNAHLFLQQYKEGSVRFCAKTQALKIEYKGLAVGKIGV